MNLLKLAKKKAPDSAMNVKPSMSMSLTNLQMLARHRGIPFGGLTKKELVKVLSRYI